MSSAKGKLVRLLGGAFLRRASVAWVEDVGGFRYVVLRGDAPFDADGPCSSGPRFLRRPTEIHKKMP